MIIEKERFEAWLFNQPRDRMVSIHDGLNCLGCAFIKETTSYTQPTFHWTIFNVVDKPEALPEWFQNLVNRGMSDSQTFGAIQDRFRLLGVTNDEIFVTVPIERPCCVY